ncbi:MAG: tetratricopeptide repeat protein [Bacteroidales bacterium]|nr:tetratricopeptide repeat protein [Bacteroidales bacterium]
MKPAIRIIFLLTILAAGFPPAFSQESLSTRFNQGVAYFNSGDYEQSLELWTGIFNSGSRSANLCYNIGNAYFKLNRIPEAILYFERAYLLDPSDEDINYNLQIARTMTVDRFQEIPELFFVRWYNFLSLSLSANAWAVFSLVTFGSLLAFLAIYMFSSAYRLKVASFWIGIAMLILSLSSVALSLRNRSLVYDSRAAIVMTPVLNGKSSPDENGTDLFVLHEGTRVSIEDKVGDWFEIRLSDGNKGWVPSNTVTAI